MAGEGAAFVNWVAREGRRGGLDRIAEQLRSGPPPPDPVGDQFIDQVARAARDDGSFVERVGAVLAAGPSYAVDDMGELVAAGLPAHMEGGLLGGN
jgi:hypothetical protein